MRTTITLENDVAAKIKKIQKKNPQKPFKEIVNELIRKGLTVSGEISQENFEIEPLEAVPHPHLNFDNISRLIEIAEGDFHK